MSTLPKIGKLSLISFIFIVNDNIYFYCGFKDSKNALLDLDNVLQKTVDPFFFEISKFRGAFE